MPNMRDVLGNLNANQALNAASQTPVAAMNYVGNPLANEGANMPAFMQRAQELGMQAPMQGGMPQAPMQGAAMPQGPFRLAGGLTSASGTPTQQAMTPPANSMNSSINPLTGAPILANANANRDALLRAELAARQARGFNVGGEVPMMNQPMMDQSMMNSSPSAANSALAFNLATAPGRLQAGTSSPATYRMGGLAYADGGMATEGMPGDMQGGMPSDMQGGMDDDSDVNPKFVEEVQRIFLTNRDNPEQIAKELLEFIADVVRNSISEEDRELLQSPEGQEALAQGINQMMAQIGGGGQGGGLAQAAGATPGGAAPPQGGLAMAGMAPQG